MKPVHRTHPGWLLSAMLMGSVSTLALDSGGGLDLGQLRLIPVAAAQTVPEGPRPAILRPGTNGTITLEVGEGMAIKTAFPLATAFVAEPDIANIQVDTAFGQPSLVLLLGKTPGKTTVIAADIDERITANLNVVVVPSLSVLRDTINQLHPGEDVRLRGVNEHVLIEGEVSTPAAGESIRNIVARGAGQSRNVIPRYSIRGSQQVMLQVRVAEVSRDITKTLGINWSSIVDPDGLTFGIATANPFAISQSALTFNQGSFNLAIDALEEQGLVSTLAEPNLVAVSGQPASFLAGGEFPILVPDSNGRVTVEYKPFGVSLRFTPTVLSGERINIKVNPEVSQPSQANAVVLSNFTVPSLITRRAETTVEMASGQTFAIAGLIQNDFTQSVSGLPGISKVPILGRLFSSDQFARNETELVILITPYMVRPSNQPLRAPNDGLSPPTDTERLVGSYGSEQTTRIAPAPPANAAPARAGTATPSLHGPVGFILNGEGQQ